jgi:hypothetical protein
VAGNFAICGGLAAVLVFAALAGFMKKHSAESSSEMNNHDSPSTPAGSPDVAAFDFRAQILGK